MQVSLGFEVRIPHHYCLAYEENGRGITLDVDFRDLVVYLSKDLIKSWDSPYSNEPISESEKCRIIGNIFDYLVHNRGFTNIVLE